MSRSVRPAAIAGTAVVLHGLSSLNNPPGSVLDESYFLLLARSLRHGAYAVPDAAGIPVSDPLPGFSLALTLPVWLLEPHWHALRLLSLAAAAAAVYLTYRLAARVLEPKTAGVVAALCALNGALVQLGGQLAPDIPFMALSLLLIDRLASLARAPGLSLILIAALAALTRPHGLLLVFSVALAVGWRWGWRRGSSFFCLSLIPLSLWLARNKYLALTAASYADNWKAQTLQFSGLAAQLRHAVELLSTLMADGVLGLDGFPPSIKLVFAALMTWAAAAGARQLLKKRGEPWLLALALFPALVICLHITWKPLFPRYSVPLLAPALIFIAAGVEKLSSGRKSIAFAGAALALLLSVRQSLPTAWAGVRSPELVFQPRTMAWIKARTPPDAKFQSFLPASVSLLTGRPAYLPDLRHADRRSWEASLTRDGFDYVSINRSWLASGGYLPYGALSFIALYQPWSEASPSLKRVFEDPGERTLIFAVGADR